MGNLIVAWKDAGLLTLARPGFYPLEPQLRMFCAWQPVSRWRLVRSESPDTDALSISHCRSIPTCRAGQNGRIYSMQQDFRYHRSKVTQEQPRAYAVEGIAAISGTSAIVGDLIIGES